MNLEWWGELLPGLGVSLQLVVLALALGMPGGIGLALMVNTRNLSVRWIAFVVVELGRGTPALVMLYLVYFGLPNLNISLGSFASAVVALGFTTAAYTSEIFRAGINGVPQGQENAARALSLTRVQQLRYIILPQAVRRVIPPLIGWSILLFQGTSLAYAISVRELMARAYNIGTLTFQFWDVLLIAAFLYALIAIPLSQLVSRLEARAGT